MQGKKCLVGLLDGVNLDVEDGLEGVGDGLQEVGGGKRPFCHNTHTRHPMILNATRDNVLEMEQSRD